VEQLAIERHSKLLEKARCVCVCVWENARVCVCGARLMIGHTD
jgi:hypothetical protein